MKDQVVDLIQQSIRAIQAEGLLPEGELPTPQVDHTRDPKHGDLATNAAMVLAKKAGMPPRDLAAVVIERLPQNNVITKCDIAGPGFINFYISQASNIAVVAIILTAGEEYGRSNEGQGRL